MGHYIGHYIGHYTGHYTGHYIGHYTVGPFFMNSASFWSRESLKKKIAKIGGHPHKKVEFKKYKYNF